MPQSPGPSGHPTLINEEVAAPNVSLQDHSGRARPQRVFLSKRRGMIWLAAGVLLAGFVLFWFVGVGNSELSADFLPRSEALQRHYSATLFEDFANDGPPSTYSLVTAWDKNGNRTFWTPDHPDDVVVDRWREQNGFLEYGGSESDQSGHWSPKLKLGAKTGDEWQRDFGLGHHRFRYADFCSVDGLPCAVIVNEGIVDGERRFVVVGWYCRGLGLVREDTWISKPSGFKPQKSHVYSEWPPNIDGMALSASYAFKDSEGPQAPWKLFVPERDSTSTFIALLDKVKRAGGIHVQLDVYAADYDRNDFFTAFGRPADIRLKPGFSLKYVPWDGYMTYPCADGDIIVEAVVAPGSVLVRGLEKR